MNPADSVPSKWYNNNIILIWCHALSLQTTHLDVLGQTGSPAGRSHVRVKSVPGRPVVHASGRYDHYVFDATTLELSVQRQHAAVALVDEHDHPARRTVRYVVQELLGRVDLIAFHLWNQEYDIITGAKYLCMINAQYSII